MDEWVASPKVKIAALWVSAMMCYIYADLIGFLAPGHLQRVLAGYMGPWKTTPALLMASAIVMSIPSLMIFLTLVLKFSVNRWLNIVLGAVHMLMAVLFTAGALTPRLYYYIYFGTIEFVLTALIVWYAVTWPKQPAT